MGLALGGSAGLGHSYRTTTASVALLAGSQAVGVLLAPGPTRGTFDEAFANEASEIRPKSYLAGTNRVVPNLTWFGDFGVKKVRNDGAIESIILNSALGGLGGYLAGGGHGGGVVPDPPSAQLGLIEGAFAGGIVAGLGALRTASYKYYAGFAYTLGWGPIDAVTEFYKDERRVYQGSNNAGSTVTVNDRNAWGGDHVNGGEFYIADIIRGDIWPVQQPNPYLKGRLGHVPAFDGMALVVLRGPSGGHEDDWSGLFSAGPQGGPLVRPFSCTVLRLPDLLGVPEYKAINGGKDANIIEVMYDWMTGRTRGYGFGGRVALDKFDMTNWRAAAQTIHSEGRGYSNEIKENGTVRDVLEQMTSFAGANIFEVPRTGEIKIKLIRRDYSLPLLKTFEQEDITSVRGFSQETYRATPNTIYLSYPDRDNNYKPRSISAQNDAAIRVVEDIIPRTIAYPGVGCEATAKIILNHELRAAFPRPPVTLVVKGRKADDVEFGEVIIWSYPKLRVAQRILRVIGIERSNTESNAVELICAEDVFGSSDALNVVIGQTLWQPDSFQYNDIDIRIPVLELRLTGVVDAINGDMNLSVPPIQIALSGIVETDATLALSIPPIQIALSGTVYDEPAIITEDGEPIITEDGDTLIQE